MEQAPTRAAILALKEERKVVGEAYDFLDEKRLLLAAELLRQLKHYVRMKEEITTRATGAQARLRAAVRRHGLQGLSVYPARPLDGFRLDTRHSNVMGVTLAENSVELPPDDPGRRPRACRPTHEAESCRAAFGELLQQSAALAAVSGNIHRLLHEYRLTERRARALENIILPEIGHTLAVITARLEETDLEDVIRAHRHGLVSSSG